MKYIGNTGEIILRLRKGRLLSRRSLAEHICSTKHLERIEKGLHSPSVFLFERLLERLGQQPDKYIYTFANINDRAIYTQTCRLRALMDMYVNKSFEAEVCKLEQLVWQRIKPSQTSLNQDFSDNFILQFLLLCKARLKIILYNDVESGLDICLDAIKLTIPNFSITSLSCLSEALLFSDEIYIINMIAQTYFAKNPQLTIDILKEIKLNIERSQVEHTLEFRLYPIILYNLSKAFGLTNDHKEELDTCELGIKSCVAQRSLHRLPQLYFNKAFALQELQQFSAARENFKISLTLAEIMGDKDLIQAISEYINTINY